MRPKFPLKRRVCYFPQYILDDILVKLPGKSLVRFKCVCKYWCSVISDPVFEVLNFQHSMSKILIMYQSQNEDEDDDDHKYESFKLDEKGSSAVKVSSFYCKPSKLKDSCNSMMLFEAQVSVLPYVSRLYIYDSINHQKKKQLLPEIPEFCSPTERRCKLVYDASRKEYKVVSFNDKFDMYICTLSDHHEESLQWRKHKSPGYQRLVRSCSSVAVNGVLYWLARDCSPDSSVFLQPMDIRTEKFKGVLELPSGQGNYQLEMKEMKGSVCLLHKAYGYRLDIWVLKDSVQNLWIKQHIIAPNYNINCHFGLNPWLAVESCNGNTYVLLTKQGEGLYWFNMSNQEIITRITVESYSVRNPSAVLFIDP